MAATFILIGVILASPVLTAWTGNEILFGIMLAASAQGLLFTLLFLKAGTMQHAQRLMPLFLTALGLPLFWIFVQLLPFFPWPHPVWESVQTAFDHTAGGHISIDLGATALASCHYGLFFAIAWLALLTGITRRFAAVILASLIFTSTVYAILLLVDDLTALRIFSTLNERDAAIDASCLALILSSCGLLALYARFQIRQVEPSTYIRIGISAMACGLAFVIGAAAVYEAGEPNLFYTVAYGFAVLGGLLIMRRLPLGPGVTAILTATGLIIGIAIVIARIPHAGDPALVFSTVDQTSIETARRMLSDVPWAGTGAGTFKALLPLYLQIGDVQQEIAIPTTAASVSLEMGRILFGVILLLLAAAFFRFGRGALQRGQDEAYPMAGAAASIVVGLLAFQNAGLNDSGLMAMCGGICGLSFAQSLSRQA